jgi:hypothetical protein
MKVGSEGRADGSESERMNVDAGGGIRPKASRRMPGTLGTVGDTTSTGRVFNWQLFAYIKKINL